MDTITVTAANELQQACDDLVQHGNYSAIVNSTELSNAEIVGYLLAAAAVDYRINAVINRNPFRLSATAMRNAVRKERPNG